MKSHLKQIDYIEMLLERLLKTTRILRTRNIELLEENKSLRETLEKVKSGIEQEEKEISNNKTSNKVISPNSLDQLKKELSGHIKELDDCITSVEKAATNG